MDPLLVLFVGLASVLAVFALVLGPLHRKFTGHVKGGLQRSDDELHRRRAELGSAIEADDIDQMIEGINEGRRRSGHVNSRHEKSRPLWAACSVELAGLEPAPS